MNVLHLFAGAGGGCLADRLLGHRCVGYVEWEPYCQAVLQARIADGLLDSAPIFGDVREFVCGGYAREYRGVADVVAGGFPCQPFSVAGKRAGSADERNMWPAFRDVVREVRPRYVFTENVPGLLSWDGGSYFGTILGDLAALGFAVRWTVLGAADCGAPHRRKRLWILANSPQHGRREGWAESAREQGRSDAPECGAAADATGGQLGIAPQWQGRGDSGRGSTEVSWWSLDPAEIPDAAQLLRNGGNDHGGCGPGQVSKLGDRAETGTPGDCWWPVESRVGRVAHGVSHRVDRLRCLGNAVVPQVAEFIGQCLIDAIDNQ